MEKTSLYNETGSGYSESNVKGITTMPLKRTYEELAQRVKTLEEEAAKRSETEEALRESEKQLRIFIENTPAPVAVCDLQMRYLAYSRRWITDYKLNEDNLIGRSHYDVFETIPARWKNEHKRCFSGEIIENEEEQFVRANGTLDWVRRKVYPWRKSNGGIGGLIMFTEVITERKLAQNALIESEEKYRKLVDNATDAIFIVQDGTIKFANPRTLEILGNETGEFQPLPYKEFIHPEDRQLVFNAHLRRLAGEENLPVSSSFRMINRGGREFIVELNAVRITWEERPATLNFVRDITDQKNMEASLQQAQKMEAIGTLAGGIAHDFNNLLMGIQGSNSLMMMDTDPFHSYYDQLKNIEECVKRATNLTRQLLGYARGGKYEVRPIDINQIIRAISDLFGRTRKEILINTEYQNDAWTVDADHTQIEQVLLNLLVNSSQAMPQGGSLHLKTENVNLTSSLASHHNVPPGRYVKIAVEDTGCGMEESIRRRVFEPFFSTKQRGQGTGLGLASTYGIIRNHGGFITVDSIKDHGTTFTLFLPASQKKAVENHQAPQQIFSGAGTVLLVDDENMMLTVGRKMLEKLGYGVLTANTGQRAVDLFSLHRGQIKLVILDMIMPGLSGSDTFDRLKEIDASVKVLLSSGYSIDGQARQILYRGCNGFIQKPFDLQAFSEKIRHVLDGAS
jgi:two-component system, cell cycle sensor histidine kinase and response regulator CckA